MGSPYLGMHVCADQRPGVYTHAVSGHRRSVISLGLGEPPLPAAIALVMDVLKDATRAK